MPCTNNFDFDEDPLAPQVEDSDDDGFGGLVVAGGGVGGGVVGVDDDDGFGDSVWGEDEEEFEEESRERELAALEERFRNMGLFFVFCFSSSFFIFFLLRFFLCPSFLFPHPLL